MPSPFPLRDAKVSGAIDRAFGEIFTFTAYSAGDDVNSRQLPDPARPAFDATGIWEAHAKSATPHARGAATDDVAHNWTGSYPSLSIDDANLRWPVRPKDSVTRHFDGMVYAVARTMPDGAGRVLLELTARKR
jgi:hypothetical protein